MSTGGSNLTQENFKGSRKHSPNQKAHFHVKFHTERYESCVTNKK